MSWYREIILLCVLTICFYTDLRYNKIYNKVLLPFLLVGITLNFLVLGSQGGIDCVIGGLIPILIFIPLFVLRMFGAGDIKLFSTIGFLMGINFIINNIIYSFLCSAIIVLILMMREKKLFKRFEYFILYMFKLSVDKEIVEYDKSSGTFPFAVGICIGTILQLIINYNFI